jgi:hypothetical protein
MSINGVSSSSPANQAYQTQQQQQTFQIPKNTQGDQQPQDTVVLSKKATEGTPTGAGQNGETH